MLLQSPEELLCWNGRCCNLWACGMLTMLTWGLPQSLFVPLFLVKPWWLQCVSLELQLLLSGCTAEEVRVGGSYGSRVCCHLSPVLKHGVPLRQLSLCPILPSPCLTPALKSCSGSNTAPLTPCYPPGAEALHQLVLHQCWHYETNSSISVL